LLDGWDSLQYVQTGDKSPTHICYEL